ncbi:MAG: glycine cleavage system protein GcvH [Parachlamydiales bacterium]|nr:glycine cleavage system protein GcvH [Verrucomicrobiota bacterium]
MSMKFTETHEWIHIENGIGTVGITDHAQKELGEVVYLELPAVGKKVKAGEEVAVLESTKAAADIYSPISGEIVAINQRLHDFINEINQDAQSRGWLFKIKVTQPDELEKLLSHEQYLEFIPDNQQN